jgi:hypothetical protein
VFVTGLRGVTADNNVVQVNNAALKHNVTQQGGHGPLEKGTSAGNALDAFAPLVGKTGTNCTGDPTRAGGYLEIVVSFGAVQGYAVFETRNKMENF